MNQFILGPANLTFKQVSTSYTDARVRERRERALEQVQAGSFCIISAGEAEATGQLVIQTDDGIFFASTVEVELDKEERKEELPK